VANTVWRNSKHADRERVSQSRRHGGGKYISQRLDLSSTPTRLHFTRKEEGYVDPFSGIAYPWQKGMRYWLPGPKKYIDAGPDNDLIMAYSNPAKYNLNIAPISRIQKISPKFYNAVAGNVEEWHHLVDMQAEDDPSRKWKERQICTGRGCEGCAHGDPKVFGKRFYIPFNGHQWKTVIEPLIEKLEHRCKCGGYIYTVNYVCANCQTMLVPMMDSCPSGCDNPELNIIDELDQVQCATCKTQWDILECNSEQLQKDVGSIIPCPSCGHKDYPVPVFQCTTENCPGDPYDIFDAQFRFKKVKDEKNPNQYDLQVVDFTISEPDPRLFITENQNYPGGDLSIAEKVAESFHKPIPLEEVFTPTDPSVVARYLNIPNVFAGDIPDSSSGGDDPGTEDPAAAAGEEAPPPGPPAKARPRFVPRARQ